MDRSGPVWGVEKLHCTSGGLDSRDHDLSAIGLIVRRDSRTVGTDTESAATAVPETALTQAPTAMMPASLSSMLMPYPRRRTRASSRWRSSSERAAPAASVRPAGCRESTSLSLKSASSALPPEVRWAGSTIPALELTRSTRSVSTLSRKRTFAPSRTTRWAVSLTCAARAARCRCSI